MAKYYQAIDSFKDVERLYAQTKPVKKRDAALHDKNWAKDIRPTNCRDRQWERILKITDDKYIMSDSLNWNMPEDLKTDGAYTKYLLACEQMAAIVWKRNKDGTETLIIRNERLWTKHAGNPNSRVDFLHRHLPRQWTVYSSEGNQYLRSPLGKFVVPRNTFVPSLFRQERVMSKAYDEYRHFDVQIKKDKRLEFTRSARGVWQGPKETYGPRVWRIDSEAKKSYRAKLRAAKDTAIPMMAMMGKVSLYENDGAVDNLIAEVLKITKVRHINRWYIRGANFNKEQLKTFRRFVVDVLADPAHEHYVGLLRLVVGQIHHARTSDDDDKFDLNHSFNTWINRALHFKTKMEVAP